MLPVCVWCACMLHVECTLRPGQRTSHPTHTHTHAPSSLDALTHAHTHTPCCWIISSQTDRQAGRQAGGRADRTDLHCLPASPPQRTHARTHAHQAASSRSPARPPARRRAARVASTSPIPTGPVSQPRPWTGHPQQQQQQLHHLMDPRHSQDKGRYGPMRSTVPTTTSQ